jgi:hypothetical protein
MDNLPSKQIRVRKDVEALIEEISELTGYGTFTVRNLAILLGLKVLARISAKQVRNGLPPTPFLTDIEFWRLYISARQSIRELEKVMEKWKERKVGVYA